MAGKILPRREIYVLSSLAGAVILLILGAVWVILRVSWLNGRGNGGAGGERLNSCNLPKIDNY